MQRKTFATATVKKAGGRTRNVHHHDRQRGP